MFCVNGEGFRLRGNAGFTWGGENCGGQGTHGMGLCWRVEGFTREQEAGRCQKASKVRLSRESRSAD